MRICLRDNGKEFNLDKYRDLLNPKDPASNVAIRMFYKIVKDVQYRNLFTMNVLTFNV